MRKEDARNEDVQRYSCCVGCSSLVVLLALILALVSINTVHYYELAFYKSKISGTIDRSVVYEQGMYLLNPDATFVTYDAATINLDMVDLSVWSRAGDNDAGTPLDIDVNIQYRLMAENLGQLYEKVGLNHEPFVRNVVVNVIKNNATRFSADEYLTKRRTIEKELGEAIKAETLQAAGVRMTNVQLMHVKFPSSYYQRKLDAAMQEQKNLVQTYKQTSTLVRDNTTLQVRLVDNQAFTVIETGKATAALLVQKAENNATEIRGEAEREGLFELLKALEVDEEKHKLSLNYLLNLRAANGGKAKKLVNLDSAIVSTST